MNYAFANTKGMYTFKDKVPSGTPIVKYFNSVFGIEKTLKNVGNTWKNQINAIKTGVEAVKAAANEADDAQDKAADAFNALNVMQYGDRTEINAKADAALAPYRK